MAQGVFTTATLIVASGDALDVEVSPYCISFDEVLPEAVNLDSSITPTASISPSGITLSGLAVNTSVFTDNDGTTCPENRGVIFVKSGGTAGQTYVAEVTGFLENGGSLVVKQRIEVR